MTSTGRYMAFTFRFSMHLLGLAIAVVAIGELVMAGCYMIEEKQGKFPLIP